MKLVSATILTLSLGLSLAGCKKQIDSSKVEASINAGLKEHSGAAPKSMVCPKDVAPKAGATFECKGVSADGVDLVITVTQKDDAGTVAWVVTSAGGVTAPPAGADHAAPAGSAAPAAGSAAPAAGSDDKGSDAAR